MSEPTPASVAGGAEKDAVEFEDVLKRCCGTGRWQVLLVGYMSLMWLLLPTLSLGLIFIGATPNFKCADGFDANATFAQLPDETPRCHPVNSSSVCGRWVYDQSVYLSTVVTEWDLVCQRKPLLSLLQSWFMLGGVVSSVAAGHLADRFGRRPVTLPMILLLVATVLASAFSPSYSFFAGMRFLSGIGILCMLTSQYVMVTEIVSVRRRAVFSLVSILPFPAGAALLSIVAYALREWWKLQLAYASPFLLLLANLWLMPESPRWLVHHGKFDDAYQVLKTGARWNGKQMPPEQEVRALMNRARQEMLLREAAANAAQDGDKDDGGVTHQLLQLVQTPRMRRYMLLSALVSFIVSGSYYGIAFDVTQLSSSPHLAGALAGICSIPAYLVSPLLDRFGRRPCIIAFFTTAAAAMLLVFTTHSPSVWLALGLIANVTTLAAFGTDTIYIPEYMPTRVRGLAYGVCQTAVRVGSTVSPFVVDLVSEHHRLAPSGVFGACLIVAAAASLFLPETRGRAMPESVADVEKRPPSAVAAASGKGDGNAENHSNAAYVTE